MNQPAESGFATTDYFNDRSLIDDPFPYFEYLRARGPVVRLPAHDVVAIVGFEEGVAAHGDSEHLSAVNSVTGPLPPLPFTPAGDDITAQIEAHRARMPFGEELLTQDAPRHPLLRSLLMRLFTPSRLRAMEPALTALADSLIDAIAPTGRIDVLPQFAQPYALLAIADLLGVPAEDRADFRRMLGAPPSQIGGGAQRDLINPLEFRKAAFLRYIAERRASPRADILSDLANATYPDGGTPDAMDVVRAASILFGAGQDTTATLLAAALRELAERPALQATLRADPAGLPAFIEEVLRIAGPVKGTYRLARRPMTLGGVAIAPGTTLMLTTAAMNRDPRRFDNPAEFRLDRPAARDHLGFGRGPHTCPGAALARAETRISLERLLARLPAFSIDEAVHGPPQARHFAYAPSYTFRALASLRLRF